MRLSKKLLHVRQVFMHGQVLAGLPDLIKDEQGGVLLIAQHVVLDAAGFQTARGHVGTKQRFKGVSFFGFGVGVQNKSVQWAHLVGSSGQWFREDKATMRWVFVTIEQMLFAAARVFPKGRNRYCAGHF
jgi:hypothetical protein